MKKFWQNNLALALGLMGCGTALGQYPAPPNSLGATAFPVQSQPQMMVQSLPQVPQGYYPGSQGQYVPPPQGQYAQPPQRQYAQPPPLQRPQHQLVGQQSVPYQFVASQDGGAIYDQALGGEPGLPAGGNYPPQPGHVNQPSYPAQPGYAPQATEPSVPAQGYGQPHYGVPGNGDCQSCAPGAAPGASYGGGYPQIATPTAMYGYGENAYGPVAASCGPVARPQLWFFGANGLLFDRVDHNNVPLSFFDSTYASDVLDTHDASPGVMGGFEVMGGRYFNCGRNAIQASYWGVFSGDDIALRDRINPGDYRSRIPYNYLDIMAPAGGAYGAPGEGVYDWYDNAYAHQLQRSSQYHNVEINLLGFGAGRAARNFSLPAGGSLFSGKHRGCGSCGGSGCSSCASSCESGCGSSCGSSCSSKLFTGPCGLTAPACGSRCNMTWLAGFRYFRFEDNLTYAASLNDAVINRSTDDLYYDVNTTNDLIGFQLGSRLDYCVTRRINLYGNAKVGIYGNHSTLYTRIATDFQNAMLNDTRTPANPNQGQAYSFNESKDDLAFLSELGTGFGVRFSPRWTGTVGYRAIIASGVATSPDNLRTSFANYSDVRNYDNYGTLILHGLSIGALYNF